MADKTPFAAADGPAPIPPLRSGRVALQYVGRHGAYTFGADGAWPLPTRDLDPDEVKRLIRTKSHLTTVLAARAHGAPLYLAVVTDAPDDLPDTDDTPPAPIGG